MIEPQIQYPDNHPLHRTINTEELAKVLGLSEGRLVQWRNWGENFGPPSFKYYGRVYYKIDKVIEWLIHVGPPRMNEKMRVLTEELARQQAEQLSSGPAAKRRASLRPADFNARLPASN